ncbi:OmpA family protein [Psychroflexus sp. YR1-1]|uniref:OmpA family protein n=1 Tax=Psychroflexus aurantiacus TaxID=2709310 RepID=A0A6B3QXG8_9FLAO|nr:OmpA family protein [Psychroflexus aurantiacus]NEV92719.1 OmpA family protein [Psychroflexus aurantiacus]
MKKITLLTSFLFLFTFIVNAQEDTADTPYTEYNKWSIDFGVGLLSTPKPFSSPQYNSGKFEDLVYNASVRYMLNEKFGLRAGAIYSEITEGDNSLPFSTDMWTFTGEGVLNLGAILNFNDFTNRFNLLAHGGVQHSTFSSDIGGNDNAFGFIAGLTPQIKLSDKVAFNLDASFLGNVSQQVGVDGNGPAGSRGFDGWVANVTAGLSIYLGSEEKHADWVDNSNEKLFGDRIATLENDLAKIERDMLDTDKDGVPDYLDREPNTLAGVAVNTKGESVDANQNGIPDELESTLNETYVTKEYALNMSQSGIAEVKPEANDKIVNVYFRFNSTQPEFYSLEAINKIVRYMKEYPKAEAVLTGYADGIGGSDYNMKLSEDRAKKIYDIVIASGIDASRLSYQGGGSVNYGPEDNMIDETRQLSRRVSFELK